MKNKKFNVVALTAIFIFVSAAPVFAYLDPGTGSMILQLLAAGVAGAIVVGRLYWHRFLVMIGMRKELQNSDAVTNNPSSEQK